MIDVTTGIGQPAFGATLFGNKAQDLMTRVTKVNVPPLQGLFQKDLYFPEFFAGTWDVESTLLSVECPAGYKLFGRQGSFEAAQSVGTMFLINDMSCYSSILVDEF